MDVLPIFKDLFFCLGQRLVIRLVFLFVLSLAVAIFDLAGIGLLLGAIFSDENRIVFVGMVLEKKSVIYLGLIAFCLRVALKVWFDAFSVRFQFDVERAMGARYINSLSAAPTWAVQEDDVASHVHLLTYTVPTVANGFLFSLLHLISILSIIIFYGLVMISLVEPFILLGGAVLLVGVGFGLSKLRLISKRQGRVASISERDRIRLVTSWFGCLGDVLKFEGAQRLSWILGRAVDAIEAPMFVQRQLESSPRHILELMVVSVLGMVFIVGEDSSDSLMAAYGLEMGLFLRIIPLYSQLFGYLQQISYSFESLLIFFGEIKKLNPIEDDNRCSKIDNFTRNFRVTLNGLTYRCGGSWYQPSFKKAPKVLSMGVLYGIAGPSGQGKSSFLRAIAGELEIAFADRSNEVLSLPVSKDVFLLSQSFGLLDASLEYNLFLREEVTDKSRSLALSLLERLDLTATCFDLDVNALAIGLSHGQMQRLLIARGLLSGCKLLCLDEPTSALDSLTEEKVFGVLREWGLNKYFLIVNHRETALEYMDEIIYCG